MTSDKDNGAEVLTASTDDSTNCEAHQRDQKIIRQVEYYFGDYNLGRDKFLKEATTKDEGWFPLETLVRFNRLKSLSTDFEVIRNALKQSNTGLLEIHEDGLKIRRSKEKPLPTYDDRRQEDVESRSVYVKGFPRELTIDDLLAYFKQQGNAEHIQMRYLFMGQNAKTKSTAEDRQSRFKGSVFVVYPTKEEALEFQKKENVKYNDIDLIREMRQDYFIRKRDERIKNKEAKKKEKAENKKDVKEEPEKLTFNKGCILHLSNVSESARREDIKAFFEPHAAVAWVDYNTGLVEADVRFKESKAQEAMDKAKEANDGKMIIKEVEVTGRLLEGDEETEYWKRFLKSQDASKEKKYNKHGRGGRGGRGGRFNRNRDGYNKRKAEKNEDEPEPKKDKLGESNDKNQPSNSGVNSKSSEVKADESAANVKTVDATNHKQAAKDTLSCAESKGLESMQTDRS